MSDFGAIPDQVSPEATQRLRDAFTALVGLMRDLGASDPEIRLAMRGALHDAEVELRAAGRSLVPRAVVLDVMGRGLDVALAEPWEPRGAGP